MNVNVLQPIKQDTLSEHVFQQIKEDIITGVIPQGQKIGETDLAKSYDISRGPLREALHKLESIQLVDRRPHSGTRVITLDCAMMRDVYQMREAMEGFAVRLACVAMPQSDIDNLYRLLEKHEATIKQSDGKQYFQKEGDLDFHYYIFSKCQNQWLINYLNDKLYQVLRMCRHRTSQIPFRVEPALHDHYAIVNAINDRDPELAEILMRRHISGAWKILENLLNQEEIKE
ncbi:GntR family transcriptional regulator [Candidatus Thioglobus sp.]|jgi:DNA-binding GntR family transcriptional regulator|uniref:GntR family transcriptional regulator n=1 Tax=Candidatus Thioglobus sp. TaxID=2026721 RepID=UPI001DE0AE8E|nr:GntR family transcriptional regulator [Candidatus Thioglobus sp.]MBT3277089.1 GntR family transcriptional regulator [Candidatus Thioglobus sp.]MBT3447363.1 GntR family transcriptional regulator [Candidatus Thioglobus sp.]MBT4422017.1 GntR family transcriptional regulator [Candidatus Thioglobus sp.]MBT4747404.1 GntR family transcriptional regulator [Candidatus Thioglobus sp.]MBT5165399.1 GntR family transcriptional regulator [Candidatus Thioglobus sp.]